MAGRLSRGEIRLIRFAPPDKERPAVVLTRDTGLQYLTRITVAPITSTIRDVPSEVALGIEDGMKTPCAVNLYNIATVHRSAIGRRVGQLGAERMREVCASLGYALECGGE